MMNKEYAQRFGINQSSVKDFVTKSPKKWKGIWIDGQEDDEKNESNYTHGSLTDTLMFNPELVNERYHIADMKLPSKAVAWIVSNTYERINKKNKEAEAINNEIPEPIALREIDLEKNEDIVIDCCNEYTEENPNKKGEKIIGWYNNWLAPTRIKKIVEDGSKYFNIIKESGGKKVITLSMNMEAIAQKNAVLEDPFTRPYFIADEGIELIFQEEIFIPHQTRSGEITLKGALDINRIDHNAKTIQECDFKTGYSAFDFLKSIKMYGYTRQHSFYNYLLQIKYADLIAKKYTLLPPINIVIDSSKIPYIYEFDYQDLRFEQFGNADYLENQYGKGHNQKIKKGWMQTLEDIAWHLKTQQWDKPRELFETGKIKVNLLNN